MKGKRNGPSITKNTSKDGSCSNVGHVLVLVTMITLDRLNAVAVMEQAKNDCHQKNMKKG